jgi:hypothetical protein
MYLFARQAQLQGAGAAEWATTIHGRVKEVRGTEVDLWTTVLSPGVSTFAWTSWWSDLGEAEAAFTTLAGDAKYNELLAQAVDFVTGPANDSLYQLLHGDPAAGSGARFVSAVSAEAAAGHFAHAVTAGIEIAQKAEQVGGHPVSFTRNITGSYAGVGWLTGYESLADFQASTEKLSADPGWVELVDSTEGAFVGDAGATQTTVYMKVA